MSFTFKKTLDPENKFSKANITYELPSDDLTVDELTEHFKYFLQACSYTIDGEIIYCQEKKQDET